MRTILGTALLFVVPLCAWPEVMARVNGVSITKEMVDSHLERAAGAGWSKLPEEKLEEARKSILEQLIRATLIEEEVAAHKIPVTDREVREQIGEMRAKISRQYGGKVALEDQLRAGYSHLGLLERMMRATIGLYKLVEQRTTEQQIKAYFKEHPNKFQPVVRARHILILTVDTETRAPLPADKARLARARIEALLAQLAPDGKNFEALARKESQCPSKEHGGDLGWFPRKGRMEETFAEAAFGLAAGETSGIVQTRFGYHIIQVTEKKTPTWEDARRPCVFARQEALMQVLLKRAKIER